MIPCPPSNPSKEDTARPQSRRAHPALSFLVAIGFWIGCLASPIPAAEHEGHGEGDSRARSAEPTPANPAVPPARDLLPESPFLTAVAPVAPSNQAKEREFQRFLDQLESGRKHRADHNFEMARSTLVPLLEGDAPPEIQQPALLELGLIAEQEKEYSRAQQVYNQYLKHFSESAMAPEVLLRQGLLYREMGAPTLALAKFYSVGSSAMKLKEGNLENYKRIVLQSQTEIANTYFLQGKYDDAVEFFQRLLKQETADLHRARIQYKLVLCFERLAKSQELEATAQEYLKRYSDTLEAPEVRFILASTLKRLGRHRESLQEVSLLLMNQPSIAKTNRAVWAYWQQRAGNEIANQLYNEGDYLNALEVYKGLLPLNPQPDWQLPVTYQIALIYEKLKQPLRAQEQYQSILKRSLEVATNSTPGARTVIDMARWRAEQLDWQLRAEKTNAFFTAAAASTTSRTPALPTSAGAVGVPPPTSSSTSTSTPQPATGSGATAKPKH